MTQIQTPARGQIRPLRYLLAIGMLAAFFVAFVASPQASAHDVLVENLPGDNEVLDEAPEEIILRFNNSILDVGEGATVVDVTDADGAHVHEGEPNISGPEVSQPLAELQDGAYRVIWRVVSSDGHPINGTFDFAVGSGGEEALAALPPVGGGNSDDHEHDHDHGEETSDHDHGDADHESDSAVADDAGQGLPTYAIVLIAVGGVAVIVAIVVLVARRGGPAN